MKLCVCLPTHISVGWCLIEHVTDHLISCYRGKRVSNHRRRYVSGLARCHIRSLCADFTTKITNNLGGSVGHLWPSNRPSVTGAVNCHRTVGRSRPKKLTHAVKKLTYRVKLSSITTFFFRTTSCALFGAKFPTFR